MQYPLTTNRLLIHDLSEADHAFLLELVNSEGWLQFIGDRHIRSAADALAYIRTILTNPNVQYYVARLADNKQPAGIVTLIRRSYLDHPDIGFAFLPAYAGYGYAHEATLAVLRHLLTSGTHDRIQAVTVADNLRSVRLLEKLGLQWETSLQHEGETLQVYGASAQHLSGFRPEARYTSYRPGATGALLDEYGRALADMKKIIEDIPGETLLRALLPVPQDSNCRSLQAILTHVVHAGFGYATSIYNLQGHNLSRREKAFHDTAAAYLRDLDDMFAFTEKVFRDITDNDLERYEAAEKIHSSWGQLYDIEQMMEHAIVHVLRHRRQTEKILEKARGL